MRNSLQPHTLREPRLTRDFNQPPATQRTAVTTTNPGSIHTRTEIGTGRVARASVMDVAGLRAQARMTSTLALHARWTVSVPGGAQRRSMMVESSSFIIARAVRLVRPGRSVCGRQGGFADCFV